MAPNSKQVEMRAALVTGFLNANSPTRGDFAASVLAAGYSRISLITRSTRYRRWLAEALQERETPAPVRMVQTQEWSPVTGRTFQNPSLPRDHSKPETTPADKPFIPEKFFHPTLGECFRTANGAAVPIWVRRDEFSGGSLNLGNLPMPGDAERRSAWAKFYADQNRLACSYQSGTRDAPPPPDLPPLHQAVEIPERGFKDAGRDVSTEALEGRFGFAEIPIWGER